MSNQTNFNPAGSGLFFFQWLRLISEVQTGIVSMLFPYLIKLGLKLFFVQPPWKQLVWQEVNFVDELKQKRSRQWRWANMQLRPCKKTDLEKMELHGYHAGLTYLWFERDSLRLSIESSNPRKGRLQCGHHGRPGKEFKLWLENDNFLRLQILDSDGCLAIELWFRVFDGGATDCLSGSIADTIGKDMLL